MKKRLAIILVLSALSIGVTYAFGVANPLSQPTDENEVSSLSQPTQKERIDGSTPKVTVKTISEADAKVRARKAIEDVGITPRNFIKAAIEKDPSTTKNYYDLDYDGAEVNLEPTTGKVLYLRDKKSQTKITKKIKTQDQAKEFAQSLYIDLQNKLNLTSGYKLAYIDNNLSDNFVLASFQKEVIPGVYSQYEQIKIGFNIEGKLESVKEFYTPVQSTDVVLTKEQAIAIATSNPDALHKMKNPNPEAVKLEVVRPNYFKYTDIEDKAVFAWVVYEGKRVLWIDAQTGSILGGDQLM